MYHVSRLLDIHMQTGMCVTGVPVFFFNFLGKESKQIVTQTGNTRSGQKQFSNSFSGNSALFKKDFKKVQIFAVFEMRHKPKSILINTFVTRCIRSGVTHLFSFFSFNSFLVTVPYKFF